MIITERLNPNAEEWRPASSQPSPLLPLTIIQTPHPPPFLPLLIPQWITYNIIHPQPIYSITNFPATNLLLGAAEKETITDHEHEDAAGESSRGKRLRKGLPPRLQRALRVAPPKQGSRNHSAAATSKIPVAVAHPNQKQVWVQKDPAANSSLKVPGGAASPPPSPPTKKTTLMIRNIPSHLRRDYMLQFMDSYCRSYSLQYDFFYLPIDFRNFGNLGYFFINLTTAAGAKKLKRVLTNFKWRNENVKSKKVCEVCWARIQGRDALVRRFKEARFDCNDLEFLPVAFDPPRDGSNQNPSPPVTLGRISVHL